MKYTFLNKKVIAIKHRVSVIGNPGGPWGFEQIFRVTWGCQEGGFPFVFDFILMTNFFEPYPPLPPLYLSVSFDVSQFLRF
jgi:hypothetical protein